MPPANLPPTPGSSTDIRGKTQLHNLGPAFTLPPAAVTDAISDRTPSSTPSANGSDSSYHPASPHSPNVNKRKHSTTSKQPTKSNDGFTLPPPPSRNRKIIHMDPKKPRTSVSEPQSVEMEAAPDAAGGKAGGRKRGANAGTTAAGRKIARKTAHSLIERRRRSKMNEEFGVLKDMIPACQGQEMHKLAILQASIDYLRYLERCITDLKSNGSSSHPTERAPERRPIQDDAMDQDDAMSDDDQAASGQTTPSTLAPLSQSQSRTSLPSLPSFSQLTTTSTMSPSLRAYSDHNARHYSISSASNYSPYIPSQNTSPVFGPYTGPSPLDASTLALTSPALKAQDATSGGQRDDREAMAALLMLNSDRRSWSEKEREKQRGSAAGGVSRPSSGGGHMSVKDLLSN